MTGLICKVCLELDGTLSEAVVEHVCTNQQTGKQFSANVCEPCLRAGRETRVTCSTFARVRA